MISALIIDDEESAVQVVKLLLQKHVPDITHIYTAVGSSAGVRAIQQHKPHLLFLDVEMPGMSGFDILQQFPQQTFAVIFITAYDHYAIQAIKYSAFDYLLKPIDTEELKNAIQKFIARNADLKKEKEKYENLLHNLNAEKISNYRLAVTTTDGTFFLASKDIIRMEADGNYTRFFLKDKKPLLTSKTLKEYDDLLSGQDFIRVHRTHLVNKKFVKCIVANHELLMEDNTAVEVSRRKWEEVKKYLQNKSS